MRALVFSRSMNRDSDSNNYVKEKGSGICSSGSFSVKSSINEVKVDAAQARMQAGKQVRS